MAASVFSRSHARHPIASPLVSSASAQSAVVNTHAAQRSVRLNNLKSHSALTSSKENVDNAYRTMIEFTETCKRERTTMAIRREH